MLSSCINFHIRKSVKSCFIYKKHLQIPLLFYQKSDNCSTPLRNMNAILYPLIEVVLLEL